MEGFSQKAFLHQLFSQHPMLSEAIAAIVLQVNGTNDVHTREREERNCVPKGEKRANYPNGNKSAIIFHQQRTC